MSDKTFTSLDYEKIFAPIHAPKKVDSEQHSSPVGPTSLDYEKIFAPIAMTGVVPHASTTSSTSSTSTFFPLTTLTSSTSTSAATATASTTATSILLSGRNPFATVDMLRTKYPEPSCGETYKYCNTNKAFGSDNRCYFVAKSGTHVCAALNYDHPASKKELKKLCEKSHQLTKEKPKPALERLFCRVHGENIGGRKDEKGTRCVICDKYCGGITTEAGVKWIKIAKKEQMDKIRRDSSHESYLRADCILM